MGRRSYGSGSKREVRPGVWELRVAGRSKTVRGGVKAAEQALAKFVTEAGNRPSYGGETLGELIDQWLPHAAVQSSTRATYTYALAHLPATMRSVKLSALTVRHFDRLYAQLAAAGIGVNTIRKLHTALSSALTEAIRWQWLAHNPARGARRPALPARNITTPSEAALTLLLATAAAEDLQAGVWLRLALACGARRGEVLALRWSNIDLKGGSVKIDESLEEDRTVKSTKTNNVRTVALDAATVAELKRWKTGQRERAIGAGGRLVRDPFVLSAAADSGTPWRPDGATQRFRRLCERADVTGVRLNDLRHAHASMLLRAGVDVVTVAHRLGHASPTTTLRQYAHVLDGADRAAAETFARAMSGS